MRLSFLDFSIEISLAPVNSLYVHEEIIPSILNKLVNDIKSNGLFKDPIIADCNSNVILDGMHRLAAARMLNLKWIPTCYINYMDNRVKVYRWWRSIYGLGLMEIVKKYFTNVKFLNSNDINDYVNKYTLLVFRNGFYVFPSKDLMEALHLAKDLENLILNFGFKIEYDLEFDALQKLNSNLCSAVITLPEISKNDVISIAKSNRVLPHKSTRHVLPFRPMNTCTPLSLLSMEDFHFANSMFINSIKSKRINIYLPGHVLDRKYDEYLYVFEGEKVED